MTKKATAEIIAAVIKQDETVIPGIKEKVIALLTGKPEPEKPQLLTQNQTAKFLGVSRQTIYLMTRKGLLKPCILPGGIKRYRVKDLEEITNTTEVTQ